MEMCARVSGGMTRPTRKASVSAQKAWAPLQKFSTKETALSSTSNRFGSSNVNNDMNKTRYRSSFRSDDEFINIRKSADRSRSSTRSSLLINSDIPSPLKRMKLALTTQSQSSSNEKSDNIKVAIKEDKNDLVTMSSRRVTSSSNADDHSEINVDVPQASAKAIGSNVELELKENIVKREEENSDVDLDEDVSMPSYLQIREQNLKANQEFLARIGMQKAKEDFESSVAKKKIFPSQRGLKQKKETEDPLPRRQSLRIRRIDPMGVPLPDEPEPAEEQVVKRLPETMNMEDRVFSKFQNDVDLKPFFSSISSLDWKGNVTPVCSLTPENAKLVADLSKLKITEEQVAKVVPGRIYSVIWHPSKSPMIAVAGDVNGFVGYWNVLAEENDANMVTAFQPHIKPVTHLHIPSNDGHKLYTSSYDATLRCGDFEKGVFDLVFSVPEEDDDLFRNFDFIGNSSSMLVSHFRGLVSLVDTRTPSKSAEQVFKVSQLSLRKVSVHPISTNYFITAGRDAKINLWDLRMMNAKSPKPVQTLKGHSKAIASAYFSPVRGNQILSSSSDDTIQIHTAKEGMTFEQTAQIRHNNHTGRWLTPFQPTWHPSVEGILVSGSMARPRQIEVFDSNGHLVTILQGDYLGSVCSLNAFHPTRQSAIVGANSSGRLHVFM